MRKPAALLVLSVALLVIAYNLRAYPQFGPPILFGFSLGVVGLVGGAIASLVVLAVRVRRERLKG